MKSFLKKFKEPKYLFKILVVALVYFLSAKFGLSLAYSYKQVTLVWPPSGIAIAVLLLFSRNLWPGITLGAFVANLTTNETPFIAFGIAVGNTLEAFVATYLLQKFDFNTSITKVKDVFKFVFFAVLLSTVISATIGTASLIYGGIGSWITYFPVWFTWWLGDAIGIIVFGGFLLVWRHLPKFNFFAFIEVLVLTIIVGFLSILIFTPLVSPLFSMHPFHFEYAILPILFWVSYRFGQKGSTLAILFVSAIAIWGTLIGNGPFTVEGSSEQSLLLLQSFIGIAALSCMSFAAIIEEKLKAEGTIVNRERRFRALIENSYDAIVLVDPKGTIKYASPSTKRIWGYEPEEVINTNGFKLIYKDDIAPSMKALSKIIFSPNKSITIQNRIIRKDGRVRWMEAVGTNLLLDPDVGAIVINFQDITERKKLDEAKSEFVSLSAHQLRSPLSVIRWYMESLLKQKSFSKSQRNYLSEIYKATLNMNGIVNLLLEISKFELGTIKLSRMQVDLIKIIKEVLDEKKKEITDKNLKVNEIYKLGIPKIISDPKLVKVIIENLISNSIKYTKAGDKISLELIPNQDLILFKIKDTGIGIPNDDQSKIFTKLFRGSNVKKLDPNGVGLGLYLIKLILDLKGGKIWFESEEGKGTTFFVEFPKRLKINK